MSTHLNILSFKITHKYKIQLLFPELEKRWGNTFSQAISIGGI